MNYLQGVDQTLLDRLSAFSPKTVERLTNTALFSAIQSLSGMPIDPWERYKWMYVGKDYKYPTIDELPLPEEYIDSYTYVQQVSTISKAMFDTTMQKVSALSSVDINSLSHQNPETCIDPFYAKNQIIFAEVVRSIPLEKFYSEPIETAQKILSFYIDLHKSIL